MCLNMILPPVGLDIDGDSKWEISGNSVSLLSDENPYGCDWS